MNGKDSATCNSFSKGSDFGISFFVVTTIYNSRESLQKTLVSLLAQTNSNIVHYIYQDGGKDDCDDLIASYQQAVMNRKRPFKVIFEKNSENVGVDLAHARCFKKCLCSHFMWLDSGDFLDPEFFQIVETNIVHHPGFSWFHVNSRPYKSGDPTIYPSFGSHLSFQGLRRKDQYANAVTFQDFTFWHYVVSSAAFRKLDPSFEFVSGKVYGGFFYDLQIFFLLTLAKEPMGYINKPLSFVLQADHSAAAEAKSSFQGRSAGRLALLSLLHRPATDSKFVEDYQTFLDGVPLVKLFYLERKYPQCRRQYHTLKRLLRQGNFPSYYFYNKKNVRFYFLGSFLPFVSRAFCKHR